MRPPYHRRFPLAKHLAYITQYSDKHDSSVEAAVLGEDTELRTITSTDPVEIGANARDGDALMVWRTPLPAAAINQLERCRVIVRIGVGYDIVDIHAAREMGIPVCNVPDYGTNDVADHAMALMLSLRRGITRFVDGLRQGNEAWHYRTGGNLQRLTNQTFGIVGMGRIGTAAALRAKAFGMRVIGYDPYVPRGHEKAIGIERVWQLEELLGQSDVVSLHTPLTPETRQMADAAFFAAMRPGAALINTARGGVLDVDALEAAMRSGQVGAAGLDVMPTEPPNPVPSLLQAWRDGEEWLDGRLIVTPHSAFYNAQSFEEMRTKAAETVREVLEGLPPRNCVNY